MRLLLNHSEVSHGILLGFVAVAIMIVFALLGTELYLRIYTDDSKVIEAGADAEIVRVETSELADYAKTLRKQFREDHKPNDNKVK